MDTPQPVAPPVTAVRPRLTPQQLGIAGAVLLAVGAFCPVLSIPLAGSMTYFNNGKGDGVLALGLAVVAAVFCVRAVRWLWIPGGLALLLIAFSFVNTQGKIADLQASSTGLGAALAAGVSLQWGWLVLGAGAACLLAAGVQARRE